MIKLEDCIIFELKITYFVTIIISSKFNLFGIFTLKSFSKQFNDFNNSLRRDAFRSNANGFTKFLKKLSDLKIISEHEKFIFFRWLIKNYHNVISESYVDMRKILVDPLTIHFAICFSQKYVVGSKRLITHVSIPFNCTTTHNFKNKHHAAV